MKNTLLAGFGNPLMRDEGIGNLIIDQLLKEIEPSPALEIVDFGTSGSKLLHKMAEKEKLIVVDCTFFKESPGTIKRFTPDDVSSSKINARLSLHDGNVLEIVALSKRLGECPEEVVIFGIQPEVVDFGEDVSESLLKKLSSYVGLIKEEIYQSA